MTKSEKTMRLVRLWSELADHIMKTTEAASQTLVDPRFPHPFNILGAATVLRVGVDREKQLRYEIDRVSAMETTD